jgi:hypothetical protein
MSFVIFKLQLNNLKPSILQESNRLHILQDYSFQSASPRSCAPGKSKSYRVTQVTGSGRGSQLLLIDG